MQNLKYTQKMHVFCQQATINYCCTVTTHQSMVAICSATHLQSPLITKHSLQCVQQPEGHVTAQ